jgi:flagellar biosynthesis/type III secretory pathway M-ring protein FliF/YscJ
VVSVVLPALIALLVVVVLVLLVLAVRRRLAAPAARPLRHAHESSEDTSA